MTLDTFFEQELEKVVAAKIDTLHSDLAQLQAVPSYENYAFRVGVITALRDYLPDMIEEAAENISKR